MKKPVQIPVDILAKLKATKNAIILESLNDLEKEFNGDRCESKLRAYVDDIGVCLDETKISKQDADDIYFKLVELVNKNYIAF